VLEIPTLDGLEIAVRDRQNLIYSSKALV